jgi:hypothetical protein
VCPYSHGYGLCARTRTAVDCVPVLPRLCTVCPYSHGALYLLSLSSSIIDISCNHTLHNLQLLNVTTVLTCQQPTNAWSVATTGFAKNTKSDAQFMARSFTTKRVLLDNLKDAVSASMRSKYDSWLEWTGSWWMDLSEIIFWRVLGTSFSLLVKLVISLIAL